MDRSLFQVQLTERISNAGAVVVVPLPGSVRSHRLSDQRPAVLSPEIIVRLTGGPVSEAVRRSVRPGPLASGVGPKANVYVKFSGNASRII